MRVALIGTRGVPARYGGFETCVEEVGQRLVRRGHDVVVYCRITPGDPTPRPESYLGMRLVHLPAVRSKVAETLSHTGLSVSHLLAHPVDAAVVFNAANAPLLPVLRARGIPVATHVDGLEWKRAKWGGNAKRYYRTAEGLAVRWSDALIADAHGIADYYRAEFDAPTELISYGAPLLERAGDDTLAAHGLVAGGYHLVVARFEPENHVDLVVEGYRRSAARLPLVVVGAAPYNDAYTAKVHACADERVRFLGSVWDQRALDQLYANSATYLHGHSVGGTNPSLLRALGAGAPVLAYDVDFNVEVARQAGCYFRDAADVARLVEGAEADPEGTRARGRSGRTRAAQYDWDDVAARYEDLCARLPELRRQRLADPDRPTGARRAPAPARFPATRRRIATATLTATGAAATTSVRVLTSSAGTAGGDTTATTGFLCSDFDLLHVGDLQAVEDARRECDRLIAGVLSDDAVRALTGSDAVVGQADRAALMEHVRGIDEVVIVHDVDPARWKAEHHFDVLFSGPGTGLELDLGASGDLGRLVALESRRTTSSSIVRETVDARWVTSGGQR